MGTAPNKRKLKFLSIAKSRFGDAFECVAFSSTRTLSGLGAAALQQCDDLFLQAVFAFFYPSPNLTGLNREDSQMLNNGRKVNLSVKIKM